ncbi:hypothetical protein ABTY20_09030 [Streptomyces sp. NPDC126497]|uniref:hypothetical protein n=1 Tax=Streptomyces sp. NPDC126497 TaxID=3155313 RepID=UPI00331B5D10
MERWVRSASVLQGVYPSHQASAAAVRVNNLHLIRGMPGRPGCGLLQMNGQPTAGNTRECEATRDRELLEPASSCHPQPLRRMRWTNTTIKVLSPQLLVGV